MNKFKNRAQTRMLPPWNVPPVAKFDMEKIDTALDVSGPQIRYVFNSETGTHEAAELQDSACNTEPKPGKFIKGPIPLYWIASANALPGKAGQVGLAVWFLAGVQRSLTVNLTGEIELIAGCKRKATYAALHQLEKNSLISVERKNGARPIVSILLIGAQQESVNRI